MFPLKYFRFLFNFLSYSQLFKSTYNTIHGSRNSDCLLLLCLSFVLIDVKAFLGNNFKHFLSFLCFAGIFVFLLALSCSGFLFVCLVVWKEAQGKQRKCHYRWHFHISLCTDIYCHQYSIRTTHAHIHSFISSNNCKKKQCKY